MSVRIKIYSSDFTERHKFVFDLVFNSLLGIDYSQTANLEEAHLNYSALESEAISITPEGLLSETKINDSILSTISFEPWDDTKCFYRTSTNEVPFDLFSAIFFLVSRYEEYVTNEKDAHNRFSAESSVLFKSQVLDQPLVNIWALKLKDLLEMRYSDLVFNPRKFEYISTIDIDQAWKFKQKGFVRNVLGFARDIQQGKWENVKARWPVYLGFKPDSFYNFDWQNKIHAKYKTKVVYFWLLGMLSKFDKNIAFGNVKQSKLIRSLHQIENVEVGIHPSYLSNGNEDGFSKEVAILDRILDTKVSHSRQHFLMHSMPYTYQNMLEDRSVIEEHTMGYSTHFGFRAGIASPFPFFDLTKNKVTTMTLVPFCMMDVTPLFYMQKSPEQAVEEIKMMVNTVKEVGGLCVSLWHNESFSETERWKGWSTVYEQMLDYVN